jgi:hypothetical protein
MSLTLDLPYGKPDISQQVRKIRADVALQYGGAGKRQQNTGCADQIASWGDINNSRLWSSCRLGGACLAARSFGGKWGGPSLIMRIPPPCTSARRTILNTKAGRHTSVARSKSSARTAKVIAEAKRVGGCLVGAAKFARTVVQLLAEEGVRMMYYGGVPFFGLFGGWVMVFAWLVPAAGGCGGLGTWSFPNLDL